MTGKSMSRQAAILEAGKKLFQSSPYEKVTTSQLALSAGVGEATLFRYFKSKEDLFATIYGSMLDEVLDAIHRGDTRVRESGPGEMAVGRWLTNRVLTVYSERCKFYLDNLQNAGRYLRAGHDRSGSAWAKKMVQQHQTIALVAQILQEAPGLDAPGANMFAQNCHAVYMHEIYRDGDLGFESATVWARLEPRLRVLLAPILDEQKQASTQFGCVRESPLAGATGK